MAPPLTFTHFLRTPENHSALLAVQDVAQTLLTNQSPFANPLLLHGPPGTGKSHLVLALIEQVSKQKPTLAVAYFSAGDFTNDKESQNPENTIYQQARQTDLLVVDDLQHLPSQAMTPFVPMMDELLANGQQMVFTANAGPQQLHHRKGAFPARFLSRLASGMAIRLDPLQPESRKILFQGTCRHLALSEDIINWLAQHATGGARQIWGITAQLEALSKLEKQPLNLDSVKKHLQTPAEDSQITVERITNTVSRYYRVKPREVKSQKRHRNLMIPRQVSMYLARQLTGLSLQQIGIYFGGRDHTTVLHACQKIESSLEWDLALSGAIKNLRASLL